MSCRPGWPASSPGSGTANPENLENFENPGNLLFVKENCMKSVLPALALAGTLPFGLAACVVVDSQAHVTRDEKRFTVSGTPDLRLITFDGAIEIHSGEARTIVVEIEKRGATREALDELKVETKQDGDRIEIEVKKPAHDI